MLGPGRGCGRELPRDVTAPHRSLPSSPGRRSPVSAPATRRSSRHPNHRAAVESHSAGLGVALNRARQPTRRSSREAGSGYTAPSSSGCSITLDPGSNDNARIQTGGPSCPVHTYEPSYSRANHSARRTAVHPASPSPMPPVIHVPPGASWISSLSCSGICSSR